MPPRLRSCGSSEGRRVSSKSSRRRATSQRGSAIVEMALTFLGFVLLLIGSMEVGFAVYDWNTCVSAAELAVRWASVNGSQSSSPATADDVRTQVKNLATAIDTNSLTITPCWYPS